MAFLLDLIFPGLGLVFQAISLTSKMSELSDEDKQDKMAEEMFQVIDKNNDGCLEVEELLEFRRNAGIQIQNTVGNMDKDKRKEVHDVLFVLKLLSTAAALGDEKEDDDEHAKKTFELSCQLFDIELPDAMDIAAGALELDEASQRTLDALIEGTQMKNEKPLTDITHDKFRRAIKAHYDTVRTGAATSFIGIIL